MTLSGHEGIKQLLHEDNTKQLALLYMCVDHVRENGADCTFSVKEVLGDWSLLYNFRQLQKRGLLEVASRTRKRVYYEITDLAGVERGFAVERKV